ncbi:MAG: SMC-Scp complex subunit ScpB [Massiliimalia sp.]
MEIEQENYFGAIEAILFASGDPVSAQRLAAALGIRVQALEQQMEKFAEQYEDCHRGIQVVSLNGSYQLCTKKEYEKPVREALELKRSTPLSPAAMEVLTVIAYNEPVTKSFIEQVRGVDSSSIVNSLHEKGLVEEAGRLEVPGRPIAYRTTETFLRSFQLESLDELPPIPDSSKAVSKESE